MSLKKSFFNLCFWKIFLLSLGLTFLLFSTFFKRCHPHCFLVCIVSDEKSAAILLFDYVRGSPTPTPRIFLRSSVYYWFLAIWLFYALVRFSSCLLCLESTQLLGHVGLQFLSNLKKCLLFFLHVYFLLPLFWRLQLNIYEFSWSFPTVIMFFKKKI